MKITLVFLSLIFFIRCDIIEETNWSFLPPVKNEWESVNTFGGSKEDIANAIILTKDGGFAIIGNTKSTDGDFYFKKREGSDVFLMKFNNLSELQWIKTYGGSDDDRGHGLVQLPDGGYALVGYSKSNDGDASENKGQHDNWVIRTDIKGELLWEKSFGFLGHDHAYNIIKTNDGALFFNGFLDVTASNGLGQNKIYSKSSSRHGVGEFWAHKIDFEGNILWRNYYGGTNNDRSYDAIETSAGDFILVGTSESQDQDIKNSIGGYDIWVIKIDKNGKLIWEKSIGGTEYDSGKSVIELPSGDILILGNSFSTNGDIVNALGSSDIVLSKISTNGEVKEVKNIGTSAFETANSFIRRPDGTLAIVGHSNSESNISDYQKIGNDIVLFYTLENGAIIKRNNLGNIGLDSGNDLVYDHNGRLIVVGSMENISEETVKRDSNKNIFVATWH